MKIAIPTKDKKLCAHFGHCDSFSFVEINNNKIVDIKEQIPNGGVSCGCTNWIAEQNVDIVLAGGMGQKPLMSLIENNIKVIPGCPELPIEEIVEKYLNNSLQPEENSCAKGEHKCHGHETGHCHH